MVLNPLIAQSIYSIGKDEKNIQLGIARPNNYLGFYSFYGEKIDMYKDLLNTVAKGTACLTDPFIQESKILSENSLDSDIDFSLTIHDLNLADCPPSLAVNEDISIDEKEIHHFILKNFNGIQVKKPNINILVYNKRYEFYWPYRLCELDISIIRSLILKELPIAKMDLKLKRYFYQLGILVERSTQGIDRRRGGKRGGILKAVFNLAQIYIINRHYEKLHTLGLVRLGDRDSSLRAWSHNDCMGNFLNHILLPFVSKTFCKGQARELFCKYIKYLPTSELKVHKDRVDMGLTMSVFLRYRKNGVDLPEDGAPLALASEEDSTQFNIYKTERGDIIFFFGFECEHFRPKLPPGEICEAVLLNYSCST